MLPIKRLDGTINTRNVIIYAVILLVLITVLVSGYYGVRDAISKHRQAELNEGISDKKADVKIGEAQLENLEADQAEINAARTESDIKINKTKERIKTNEQKSAQSRKRLQEPISDRSNSNLSIDERATRALADANELLDSGMQDGSNRQ